MADATSHLEKMGQELKCPICLSLLNNAVSLICNHVFCNLCIVKSMKSGSDCPVCKVPYRRREVRSAPHMDNMVNIYKSMEVASGVNIFVTQNVPPTKLSEEAKQPEADQSRVEQATEKTAHKKTQKKTRLRAKRSKNISNTNSTLPSTTNADPVKPSFPNKKRVQVAHYPLPETPVQPAKTEHERAENTRNEAKNISVSLYDQMKKKGEPVFSPFFWLRDDVDEMLTPLTDSDHGLNTPPLALSFSDIRDSDDERLCEMNPKGALHGESLKADFFDSEMFEWTQRACSPELFSTPTKMQVNDTQEASHVRNVSQESMDGEKSSEKFRDQVVIADDAVLRNLASPRTENVNVQNITKKSNKRHKKASGRTTQKFFKGKTDQVIGSGIAPKGASEMQELTCKNKNEDAKMPKITGVDLSADKPTLGNTPPTSVGTICLKENEINFLKESPALLYKKKCSNKDFKLNNAGSVKEIKSQNQIDCSASTKNKRRGSGKNKAFEEDYITENHKNQDTDNQLPSSLVLNKNLYESQGQPKKRSREIKSSTSLKFCRSLKGSKKLKVSFDNIAEDNCLDSVSFMPVAKDNQHVKHAKKDPSSITKCQSVLRKCESVSVKTQCVFCHTAEGSEASGDMVHYFNGKPVAADYNGGSDVIHSHRNCTEWAPNVYFEGDAAKNLKAEITRSRRITCSCCGMKGAALGCFEKSCRKSFHVPCAKLMPECRWDDENFVILCPLHVSSKLPCEFTGSQVKQRRQCIPKVKTSRQQECVSPKDDISPSWNWGSFVLSDKMILCCSHLTDVEKDIVSEFKKISGVTESTKWTPSVTHVIASMDENGAYKRTLKTLMGILEGKWILSVDWIKACMKEMEPVDEERFEILLDTHGIHNGPRLGRQRIARKEPKLFDKFMFYFTGDFMHSYKGYLQDLVIAAGGTILHRKPVSVDHEAVVSSHSRVSTFIIYSIELPDKCSPKKINIILMRRKSDAQALANSTGAKAATNSWILKSIAACQLQQIDDEFNFVI